MKNDNFYKTLRIVCLILAIVCMALSLFKKAKAAEISDFTEYINDCYDYSLQYHTQYTDNIMNDIINNSVGFYEFYNDNDEHLFVFSNNEYAQGYVYNQRFNPTSYTEPFNMNISKQLDYYYGSNSFTMFYTDSSHRIDINNLIVYSVFTSPNQLLIYKGIVGSNTYWQDLSSSPGYYITFENRRYKYNSNDGTWITGSDLSSFVAKYFHSVGNNVIGSYYSDSFRAYTSPEIYTEDMLNPPSTNTDGFEVYKYGASGSERLVCDFSNCISISNAVGNSSTIQIDITIDGVDQSFNFDSTSTYYDYSVPSHIAKYSFPLSIFGINNETISARLTEVTIVNATSSPGGSGSNNIVWLTPLILVGSDYEDLEPDVIPKEQMPDFDYYDDPTTQTSYNGTMNRWLTSSYSSFDYSLFTRWNFSPKYLVIGVEPYNASQALKDSLADFIRAIGNLEFGNALAEAITVGQGKTLQEQITEYLNDHLYITDLYDIIVFGYLPSENGSMEYYIYTTDSYNNHLNNSLMYDLIQQVADDGKAIEKTYDYLYDRLNDFEDKTLTKFNEMVGLQEIENGFISSLQSILNQILNALLNLNIEFPEADYSSITSRLDQIISNQGSSNLNGDWYQNYREWLYGINENDSYLSPHEYFNNIFGSLKTTYDSFTKNLSFNAYILKVEDFLDHISGNTSDNLTIYLRDGIGDPGFNINNNYMYTVGGS